MEKVVLKYAFILVFVVIGVAFSSCANKKENAQVSLADSISGKWKLLKCNSSICTWDEYMLISGNTMNWNKKKAGHDSRYQLSYDSKNSFSAKCDFSGNGKDGDCSFVITDCSAVSLTIVDSEGNTRVFAKDLSSKMVTASTERPHLALLAK